MKRLYALLLGGLAVLPAFSQWNTNATPTCIYDATGHGDYYACNPKAVRTADKKTWISWRTSGRKEVNGIGRGAVCTYLQLLDKDGVPQFSEPIQVNDHVTPSWWSEYGLQVAADGSAIVTVADGRAEEAFMSDDQDIVYHFSPAIYKIDQQGNFLWGEDGIAYTEYTNAPYTNCYVVGDDTYFIFYNTSEDGTGVSDDMSHIGVFIQRINSDGTEGWDTPMPWADEFIQPQIIPSLDGSMLLFDKSPEGSLVHRLNRDFDELWGDPVVYDDHKYDGYAMNHYCIAPDGKGGAAVAFVRNVGQFSHNIRVQHINADGSLGFGLTGLDAANTEDNDYDYCGIAVNPKTEEILVDFESQLPNSYDVMLQKFSYDGDYLFDEMGLSIASKDKNNAYAFGKVGCGAVGESDWIVIYRDVQAWVNASFIIRRYDSEGNRIWTRTIGREIDPTSISYFVEDEATYLIYRETRENKEPGIKIFRIGNDGSYNVTYPDDLGVEQVTPTASGEAQYFDASGRQLPKAQKGLTIVRKSDGTVEKHLR